MTLRFIDFITGEPPNTRMKLRQNGTVSLSIKLAAFQASGRAEPRTQNLTPISLR
jgi:hypothetical protein